MASYFVSPGGRGTLCTKEAPGELDTGINRAVPGDEIILTDGTYRQFVRFKRSGERGKPITLRAENPQQAIIALPRGVREGKFGGKNSVINTTPYSYITIRGLTVDGRDRGESGVTADNGSNIVIEYNHIRNTGSGGIGMKGTSDSKIRFNLIENTGKSLLGEGLYIGQMRGELPVLRVEAYGNIIRRACMNFIDSKLGNQNINIHHNLMEDLMPGRARPDLNARSYSDGLILLGGSAQNGSRVQDNIIRHVTRDRPAQLLKISQNSRHLVQRNLFYNINNQRAISGHQNGATDPSVIAENMMHALASQVVNSRASTSGIAITNNAVDVTEADCEAEKRRIISEMIALDGASLAPWIMDLADELEDHEDEESEEENEEDEEETDVSCEFPCGFCGRSEEEVGGFIVCASATMICSECIVNVYKQYIEWAVEHEESTPL